MSPQIEAAWIAGASAVLGVLVGVTGTTIVAIAGFRNTRSATDKSLRAARSARLWDRKADAYQETLTAVLQRKGQREQLIKDLTEEQYGKAVAKAKDLQTRQESWNTQGKLRAFGAPEVLEAFQNTVEADGLVNLRHDEWQASGLKALRAAQTQPPPPDREARIQAATAVPTKASTKAFEDALRAATAADSELEQAIRNDLKEDSDDTEPDRRALSLPPEEVQGFRDLNLKTIDPGATEEGMR